MTTPTDKMPVNANRVGLILSMLSILDTAIKVLTGTTDDKPPDTVSHHLMTAVVIVMLCLLMREVFTTDQDNGQMLEEVPDIANDTEDGQ